MGISVGNIPAEYTGPADPAGFSGPILFGAALYAGLLPERRRPRQRSKKPGWKTKTRLGRDSDLRLKEGRRSLKPSKNPPGGGASEMTPLMTDRATFLKDPSPVCHASLCRKRPKPAINTKVEHRFAIVKGDFDTGNPGIKVCEGRRQNGICCSPWQA